MARPSDIETKAVATRVPMSDYIKFLTEATNNKQSMSDFLLLKLYHRPTTEVKAFKEGGNIEDASKLDAVIKEKDAQYQKALDNGKASREKLNSRIAELEKEIATKQKQATESADKIKGFQEEITFLNKIWGFVERLDELAVQEQRANNRNRYNWDDDYGKQLKELFASRMNFKNKYGIIK